MADRVTLESPVFAGTPTFETINFDQSYTSPLVFTMPDDGVTSESSVRVDVGPTSFDIAHVVPDNSSTSFPRTEIDYLVVETGEYTIDGVDFVAGSESTQVFQSKFDVAGSGWITVTFPVGKFTTAPTVLTQIQTMNNETTTALLASPSRPWMTVAVRNLTAASMQIALDRAETTTGSITSNETIAYLAIETSGTSNSGTFNDGTNDIDFKNIATSNTVTQACTAFTLTTLTGAPDVIGLASQTTRDGGDGGWVRRCSISPTSMSVKIQEDIATDADITPTTETVGLLAFSESFSFSNGGFPLEANVVSFSLLGAASLAPTVVNFGATFDSTPRVFVLPTNEEPEATSIRILSVSTTGFTMAQVQPDASPAPASSMQVDYIAAIDGIHALDDNTIVDVGTLPVSTTIGLGGGTYTPLTFAYEDFPTSPVTLLQIQTTNSEGALDPTTISVPWLAVAAVAVDALTMNVSLERAQVTDGGTVSSETIAYMAVTNTALGNFDPVEGGTTISFETLRVTNIEGVDNGCDTNNFVGTYSSSPIVGASQSARNGSDGGWAKRCSLSSTTIGLQIDEDSDADAERAHIAEDVDILVFSETFAGDFAQPELVINYNPDVATQTPTGVVEYSILVTNTGAARASIIELETTINDFAGLKMDTYLGLPFNLVPGGVDPEVVLGTPLYTEDNGADSFGYSPVPPIDNNVTDFRIPMIGDMPSGTEFTVQYQVEIQ